VEYLHNLMGRSRSQRQVLILDCCHSGAIAKGLRHKGSEKVQVLPKLGGEGRAILTASDSTEYAFEQEGFELSLYTHFLVKGLKTGAADQDGDGFIAVDELYDYVRHEVRNENDAMSPEFYPVKEGHRIILAKAALDDPKLEFRKEIEAIIVKRNGKIFPSTLQLIANAKIRHGITDKEADEIEQDILRRYQESEKNLKAYEKFLQDIIDNEFPFSEITQEEIEACERDSRCKPEDIQEVKSRILASKQAEYDRQLEEAQRQEPVARLNRQQEEDAERLRPQQAIAEERDRYWQEINFTAFLSRRNFLTFVGLTAGGISLASVWREISKPLPPSSPIPNTTSFDLGKGISLELVKIPAGKFMMGSDEHTYEQPIHEVTVPEFWMSKYTFTNVQWEALMGTKPSEKYDVKFQDKNQPVVGVSWDECVNFCKKLSDKTGKNFRLPSEAEWEYACRARIQTKYYFGDDENQLAAYGWYSSNSGGQTHAVGQKTPNTFGLYDMHGNVWEWCSDRWHESYNVASDNNAPTDGSSWKTGTDDKRVQRGGSWGNDAVNCRSANRSWYSAGLYLRNISFRVALVLPPVLSLP